MNVWAEWPTSAGLLLRVLGALLLCVVCKCASVTSWLTLCRLCMSCTMPDHGWLYRDNNLVNKLRD